MECRWVRRAEECAQGSSVLGSLWRVSRGKWHRSSTGRAALVCDSVDYSLGRPAKRSAIEEEKGTQG
eukprot:6175510-Pleurochrysis_carterae.AAC.1